MLVIIASLLAGYIIGYLTRRHPVKKTPAIINALIWLLLLLMGWEVGSTPNLAESLSTLGKEALILGEFYQFNLSSCIRQQNSLTAQFVSFSLANLANIFYPPPDFYNN